MNINRHNYEEYFLLYVDGELSYADRAQVEAFAAQHPDLAEELDMLREAVLDGGSSPEMPGKEALLKPALWDADQLTPHQQQLLQGLDGELSPAEQAALQKAMNEDVLLKKEWEILQQIVLPATAVPMPAKHILLHTTQWHDEEIAPWQQRLLAHLHGDLDEQEAAQLQWELQRDLQLHKEWSLLQQTRLQPDTIVMPGKERLLRRAKAPIVTMLWVRRLAAAAVITGVGWMMWSQIDNPGTTPAKSGTEVVKGNQPNTTATGTQPVSQQASENLEANQAASATNTAADAPQLAKAEVAPNVNAGEHTAVGTAQPVHIGAEEQPEYIAERPLLTASHTVNQASIETVNAIPAANSNPLVAASQPQMIAQQAAFDEADYFNAEDERISIGGLPIRKEKLRGIYRTVTRTLAQPFEKRNLADADNSGQPMK